MGLVSIPSRTPGTRVLPAFSQRGLVSPGELRNSAHQVLLVHSQTIHGWLRNGQGLWPCLGERPASPDGYGLGDGRSVQTART